MNTGLIVDNISIYVDRITIEARNCLREFIWATTMGRIVPDSGVEVDCVEMGRNYVSSQCAVVFKAMNGNCRLRMTEQSSFELVGEDALTHMFHNFVVGSFPIGPGSIVFADIVKASNSLNAAAVAAAAVAAAVVSATDAAVAVAAAVAAADAAPVSGTKRKVDEDTGGDDVLFPVILRRHAWCLPVEDVEVSDVETEED